MDSREGEFARIAHFFAPLAASRPDALGLRDDTALMWVPGAEERIAATVDTIVAGVHFIGDEAPGLIARKLLRVNLSDLAAMGARPSAYMLSMALPEAISDDWLGAFTAGLAQDQNLYGIGLIGGDSVTTPGPLTLTVAAYGLVPENRALRRDGARPGDGVYASGTIGDAALGLQCLRGELSGLAGDARDGLVARYRLPEPRVELGLALRAVATAAIDVSDGLAADLGHIAAASGVAITIEAGAVPLSPPAQTALEGVPGLIETVLTGGDDYELAFTLPPESVMALDAASENTPITRIGAVSEGTGVVMLDPAGIPVELARMGFSHPVS